MELDGIQLNKALLSNTLPSIEDIAQLKVLLFAIWFAQRSGDESNPITSSDFFSYPELLTQLGKTAAEQQKNLFDAIQKNIEGELFIGNSLAAIKQGHPFFLNTKRGQQTAEMNGQITRSGSRGAVQEIQKNVFQHYEENIGPLTPMIADAIKDAEQDYPLEWITEAIQIAVVNNVRKWRYIQAILRSWKEEGRNGRDKRDAEEDYKRYTQGKYGKFIKNK